MIFRFVPLALAFGLTACSTVELPDIGKNLSDFRSSVDSLDSAYMQAEELPSAPEGVRSAREWDAAAREMQALRSGFDVPSTEPALSDGEFADRVRDAERYAREYRNDDPS